jgi:hypothetical protein
MTDETSRIARGLSRRRLLVSGLLTGVGATAFTVGVPDLTGVAWASTNVLATAPNGQEVGFTCQPAWTWCSNCQGVYFGEYGYCPDTSAQFHVVGSDWNYQAPYGTPPSAAASYLQANWQYCYGCTLLYYAPRNTSNGYCADPSLGSTGHSSAGGTYNYNGGSYNYYLPHGEGWQGGPMENNWEWCYLCDTLFFGPNTDQSICPNPDAPNIYHSGSKSWNYYMPSPNA